MSDNSIAILQAADAYRKQLQVRNKLSEIERELMANLDASRQQLRKADDELVALGENLHAQAGGYAPTVGNISVTVTLDDAVAGTSMPNMGMRQGY